MIGLDLDSATSVFGRVATLGAAYGLDVSPLLDRLTAVARELAEEALITVPSTFDRIAVGTKIHRGNDGVDRVRVLAATCDAEQPKRLESIAGRETQDLLVEIESLPEDRQAFAFTVTGYGRRVLAADLEQLGRFGVGSDVLARLEALATELVGPDKLIGLSDRAETTGSRSWTMHVAHRNADDAQRAASRSRVGAVAAKVGVTGPQRNVVDGLYDAFAGDRESYSWLRVTEGSSQIEMGVLWANVQWEDVVNIMLNLYPKRESSSRLGQFSGAFDAAAASGVQIELGTKEPPEMRVVITTTKGKA